MTQFNVSAAGKFIAGNAVEIWLDDGIVHVLYLDHAEITIDIKKEMHRIYLHITGGKKHPFLFGAIGSIWFTKDARDFAGEIEPKQPFLAVAMHAPTLGYRLMAEFYGKFNNPIAPYRVFKDMEEALAWLRSF